MLVGWDGLQLAPVSYVSFLEEGRCLPRWLWLTLARSRSVVWVLKCGSYLGPQWLQCVPSCPRCGCWLPFCPRCGCYHHAPEYGGEDCIRKPGRRGHKKASIHGGKVEIIGPRALSRYCSCGQQGLSCGTVIVLVAPLVVELQPSARPVSVVLGVQWF